MPWKSTKTYGHEAGLSACFRQWRADHSHCSQLHGYALSFKFTFESDELDERNWVMDFGGLKPLREWLKATFDHRLLVAEDDPHITAFMALGDLKLANVVVVDAVGCERFAEMAGQYVNTWLAQYASRVRCTEVECREHGANSAIWVAS